jgi:hypothetical protein
MSKAPAPKPDPEMPGSFLPNGAASKAGLNRSINDAGWGVFLTILTSKAESAGRKVIAVDPRNTSRQCPNAGTQPRRTGPHRRSSTASRAATARTLTQWEQSMFHGPGWSVAKPNRHSEKPLPSGAGGVTDIQEEQRQLRGIGHGDTLSAPRPGERGESAGDSIAPSSVHRTAPHRRADRQTG